MTETLRNDPTTHRVTWAELYTKRQDTLRLMADVTLAEPIRYPASVLRLADECDTYGMPTKAVLLRLAAKEAS